jgi:hypothetical protein
VALIGNGTNLTAANFSHTITEDCCFFVNGYDLNRYIHSDGVTVTTATGSTGHLYNSPTAHKINYYKNKLYLGDYTVGANRYKNGIMMSSEPLGIISLVNGDHLSGVTTINVTDSKYIYATDSLDVYRGNTKIQTLTVSAKTENTITVTATTNALLSSDELWVKDTYDGTTSKKFRWAGNPASGINVKQYDTMFLSGGQNDAITMMTNIGDVMMIGNKHNLAVWNNSSLQNIDIGVGCVSERGYVKNDGVLYFLDYSGVYATTGGLPKQVSAKVQSYFDGSTKAGLEAGAMGKKGSSVFCSLGDVTLYWPDGSIRETLTDVVMEFNVQQQNWYILTGISSTQFATYITSSDTDRLEYSDDGTNCDILEFLYSGSAVDNDGVTNKEILFEIETNNINFSKPFERVVFPIEVILEAERGHAIQCFVKLDDGQPYELSGEGVKGCTVFRIKNKDINNSVPVRCRNLSVILKDFSKSLCKITRIAVTYLPSNEEYTQDSVTYGK